MPGRCFRFMVSTCQSNDQPKAQPNDQSIYEPDNQANDRPCSRRLGQSNHCPSDEANAQTYPDGVVPVLRTGKERLWLHLFDEKDRLVALE